jgi:hypothetical protein
MHPATRAGVDEPEEMSVAGVRVTDMNDNDATYRPILRTQADLDAAWRHLIGALTFDARSVWLMTIEADQRPFPHLTEFSGLDDLPRAAFLRQLTGLLRRIFEEFPPDRLAFLVSRPGDDGVRPADRAWALALHQLARDLSLACDVVHLATDCGVVPVPLDELGTVTA